jgi:Domain of unknown function (DUF4760)
MVPQFQFRFTLPYLVLVVGLGIGVIVLYAVIPGQRDVIKFSAVMVGGVTAIYSLLLNAQATRTASAAKFIERWNRPDFAVYGKVVSDALETNTVTQFDRQTNLAVLNFWEELAVAANRGEAYESLLDAFFHTAAIRYFEAAKPWIDAQRIALHIPTGYIEYERMAVRWQKGR